MDHREVLGIMDDGTGPTIGQTIARLRRNRMSQNDLAAAAGLSVDVVRKLEQGRRHTASIPTLQRLARALDVDVADLLGKPRAIPQAGPDSGAVAIRAALSSVEDLLDGVGDGPEPLTLDEARRTVGYAWAGYWAGRYDALGRLLPSALGQLRATLRAASTGDRPEVADLAAQLHQVAACTCVQVGHADIAHLALRQALVMAEQGSDPLRPLALRGSVAWVLMTQGRYDESHQLSVDAAQKAEPAGGDVPGLTLHGALLVGAASALARGGDRDSAADVLQDAGAIAERTGYRDDYECAFGPDQVRMQRVDINIVTENFGAALTAASKMPATPTLPLVARCRHQSDVALAQARMGRDRAALDTLLAMEQAAPTWMHFQAPPREIVRELWGRAAPTGLRALAGRMGVALA